MSGYYIISITRYYIQFHAGRFSTGQRGLHADAGGGTGDSWFQMFDFRSSGSGTGAKLGTRLHSPVPARSRDLPQPRQRHTRSGTGNPNTVRSQVPFRESGGLFFVLRRPCGLAFGPVPHRHGSGRPPEMTANRKGASEPMMPVCPSRRDPRDPGSTSTPP